MNYGKFLDGPGSVFNLSEVLNGRTSLCLTTKNAVANQRCVRKGTVSAKEKHNWAPRFSTKPAVASVLGFKTSISVIVPYLFDWISNQHFGCDLTTDSK